MRRPLGTNTADVEQKGDDEERGGGALIALMVRRGEAGEEYINYRKRLWILEY